MGCRTNQYVAFVFTPSKNMAERFFAPPGQENIF